MIILDVKVGSGAFMKTIDEARQLAQTMVNIGRQVGKETVAAITDMEQPLGYAIGNSLEVKEAIETLKGDGPPDLVELCLRIGGLAMTLGGKATTPTEGEKIIQEVLSSGCGAEKFKQIVEFQGGDARVLDDLSLLPKAPIVREVLSPFRGFVQRLDAFAIAQAEMVLGGCRGAIGVSPTQPLGFFYIEKLATAYL